MIGEMIRNEDGSVTGYIAEPNYGFSHVYLEKVVSDNTRAPLFDLKTPTPIGTAFRLGSIWERTAKKTGEVYFGGYIDSSRSGYIPLRLFRSRQNPNVWRVVRRDELGKQGQHTGAQETDMPAPPAPKRAAKRTAPKQAEPVTA